MRTIWRVCVAMTAAAFSLPSCTQLISNGAPDSDGNSTPQGLAYHLPELEYEVEITRVLTRCPDKPPSDLRFDASAKATASTHPGAPIFIDYRELGDAFKTTDATFDLHPNGMLKSINVGVADHSAEVATAAVKSVVAVGKMIIGVPSPGFTAADNGAPKAEIACTKEAQSTVEDIPRLKKKAAEKATTLKSIAEEASKFEAAHAKDNPRSKATIAAIDKNIREQHQAQQDSDAASEAYAKALSRVTLIGAATVTPTKKEIAGTWSLLTDITRGSATLTGILQLKLSPASGGMLSVPLKSNGVPEEAKVVWERKPAKSADAGAVFRQLRQEYPATINQALGRVLGSGTVVIALGGLTSQSVSSSVGAAKSVCGPKNTEGCGILYRTQAQGRIQICKGLDFTMELEAAASECWKLRIGDQNILFREDRSIPQLGEVASLPLNNSAFSNNTLQAEFREDGTLTKVVYKKANAEAAAGVGALNSGLEGAQQLLDARRAAAQEPSQVTQVKNETDLLEAQRAKIAKQIELLEEQRKLDALRVTSPAP